MFYQRLSQRIEVLEASFVQQGVATFVNDFNKGNIQVYLQTSHYGSLVFFLEIGKGLIDNVFHPKLGLACLLYFI